MASWSLPRTASPVAFWSVCVVQLFSSLYTNLSLPSLYTGKLFLHPCTEVPGCPQFFFLYPSFITQLLLSPACTHAGFYNSDHCCVSTHTHTHTRTGLSVPGVSVEGWLYPGEWGHSTGDPLPAPSSVGQGLLGSARSPSEENLKESGIHLCKCCIVETALLVFVSAIVQ